VTINTPVLLVTDGARVSVGNQGRGNAGLIRLNAGLLQLDKKGSITANSNSGEGGNIYLETNSLQLRRNSNISTTSGGVGNGGNISINTETLVALENSDITANARLGSGGEININARGIIGTEYRQQLTPESDITATSEKGASFNGVVNINALAVNPSFALVELSQTLTNSSAKIIAGCAASNGNNFVITGRGGLPSSPNDLLTGNQGLVDLVDLIDFGYGNSNISTYNHPSNTHSEEIVEAQGLIMDANGQASLVTSVAKSTPHAPEISQASCH
jgi:large exoprotein involved in heme utilization and adhesion